MSKSVRCSKRIVGGLFVPRDMRADVPAAGSIAVLPLGSVSEETLGFVEDLLGAVFGLNVESLPKTCIPSSFYDPHRDQDSADDFLSLLFEAFPDRSMRILGVSEQDMFAVGRTFVYGYAHLRDGVAVVSTARLRGSWYGKAEDKKRFRARVYRTVVHEISHTFGLSHCERACIMHAVSQIDSLDRLSPSFCASCSIKVRMGVQVAPMGAEGRFLRAGALLRRRYLARAIDAYREATEKAPIEPRYHNDLGVALLAAGDREGARAAFRQATELSADFPHPYYNLGILCREEGGAEAAERFFAEGLRRDRDPIAAYGYSVRAAAYRAMGERLGGSR